MTLCANCLASDQGTMRVPVGYPSGSQRDPDQRVLILCDQCKDLLVSGNLPEFHARYENIRTIQR
jgi:hypothetical protein